MTTKTMASAIGHNIRTHREQRGMSLATLGERVARLTGNQSWNNRGLGSAAERGDRDFKVTELVAIAHALGVRSWTLLLVDPLVADEVDLGGGTVTVDELQPLGDIPNPDSAANQLAEVRTLHGQTTAGANELADQVEALKEQTMDLYGAIGEANSKYLKVLDDIETADGMLHSVYRDVARFARGSTTTRSSD